MAVGSDLERYQFISTLGTGGMATVALAEDQLLGRQVALKRLSPSIGGLAGAPDPQAISRLRREALVGASINHPNLVSIYDVVDSGDGELVIVMEYVPGRTLAQELTQRGKLSAADALPILEGVAAGLDAIHRRGIVHRDVKPANILLGENGAVKLADLGIAVAPDSTRITSAGAIMGSFRYMAPEQLSDTPSTSAIDIYALSAVAFEVLSGVQARGEPNPLALAHAIATEPPPDLRARWSDAPEAAAALLRRGMARELAERPASASELVAGLRSALLPKPAAPAPAPMPPTAPTAVTAPAGAPSAPDANAVKPAAAAVPAAAAAAPRPAGARRAAPARPARPTRAGSRPPAQPSRAPRGGGDETARSPLGRRLLPALLVALAAAGVVAIALAASGGSGSDRARQTATTHPAKAASGHRSAAAAPASRSSRSSSHPASASQPSSAAPGTSVAAAGRPAATPAVGGGSASSPTGAVEAFYGMAAAHQYGPAWALADPAFRQQLQGYDSFQAGQAGDRSITFQSATVVNQSSGAATVAVRTTSTRTDGTQHCGGTVDLVKGGSGWLLHQIHINCA